MQILQTSALISLNRTGVAIASKPEQDAMFFHLTKGFSSNPQKMSNAVFFDGTVEAITSKSEFASWRFGFIQLMQLIEYKVIYLGRTKGDGQVTIEASTNLLLDSKPGIQPYTSVDNATLVDIPFQQAGRISTDFGDHPSSKVKLTANNRLTRANMFLFRFLDHRLAVTALVAEDPQGKRQILAHMTWLLKYQFEYIWRSQKPSVVSNVSSLIPSSSKLGPPTGGAEGTITKGTPPNYNAHAQTRIFNAVMGKGRRDEDFPSAKGVRDDFFR